jgi:hypothetical protein
MIDLFPPDVHVGNELEKRRTMDKKGIRRCERDQGLF